MWIIGSENGIAVELKIIVIENGIDQRMMTVNGSVIRVILILFMMIIIKKESIHV